MKDATTLHHLSGELTVRIIADTYRQVCDMLSQEDEAILDLGGVTDCDLTFVQVLESARRSAARDNKRFALAAPASGPLLDVLRRAGVVPAKTEAHRDFWLHGEDVAA